ncbi:MAG: AMP-binding protein, partial [Clostridiales Family XIII bacterium]|nr:AMP-binding protein [Clostridiales Family XIII bacterium]
ITYQEAFADICAVGAAMTEHGLRGKKIALLGENSYPWIVSYLAAVSGGIVAVPLGTELGADAIHNLLGIAGCDAIFYSERFDEIVAEAAVPLKFRMNRYTGAEDPAGTLTWNGLLAEGRALPAERIRAFRKQEIDPDAMSLLMFTSGTTGNAKGVMLSTAHVGRNVWDMEQAHDIQPGDITVSILPIYHIFEAVMGQQFMFAHGATVAFGDGIKYLKKNMAEAGANVQLLVPLLVENFYKTIWRQARRDGREEDLVRRIREFRKIRDEHAERYGREDDREVRAIGRGMFREELAEFGGKLEMIFTGAAAIDVKYIKGLHDIGLKVTQGYGMTEAGCLISATPYFSDTYEAAGSVGPVTPSGKIRIANPDENGVGEILYTGPCVMKGYYNMPEQTSQVMEDGWFHTGDFGFLDSRGWLYITGRKNNIIVTKTGKNIFPEELEFELAKDPRVGEIMIYGGTDSIRGGIAVSIQMRPNLEAVTADKGELTPEEVLELMKGIVAEYNTTLPNYKRIRNVYVRDTEFVKTATGKLMRQASIDTYSG